MEEEEEEEEEEGTMEEEDTMVVAEVEVRIPYSTTIAQSSIRPPIHHLIHSLSSFLF